ncbi:MAG TPA: sulfatase-like hydrolase/transferase [Chthoniobacteraceae bacterium]|nr:sulfatase-like hydrolase/transferase [Chthoniobacteraceae bacterium]
MSDSPNILLITSDQQHWNTLGRHWNEIATPNLDRLAAQGSDFRRAYCPNPTCTPTRASILTGQYPSRHGAWSLGTKLPETAQTVSQLLSDAGYATALIGKAHFQQIRTDERWPSVESYPVLRDLEFWRGFSERFYGFDHVEMARNHGDEAHVGQHYALWMEANGFCEWPDHFRNTSGPFDFTGGGKKNPPQHGAWTLPERFHMNTWITERSGAWMEKCGAENRPFFLWASYLDPHPPYLVPEPWASMYDPAKVTVPTAQEGEHDDSPEYIRRTQLANPDFSDFLETPWQNHGLSSHLCSEEELRRNIALYYGMISMLDHSVGQLLDRLEELGQAENTLVVYTSDHGHYYGHHGLTRKGPFHYEDGIRVPFLARWPGQIPAGAESGALQTLVDLAPTFLSAAGVPVPRTMQGINQLPVWTGSQAQGREQVMVEFRHQPTAIHLKTLVEERYKITLHYNRPYGELYDLQEDPGEIHNLWDRPEAAPLREEMTRRLAFAMMGDEPLWMPRVAVA